MAEISYYWDGTATGDATSAPYTAALYTTNWKKLFTRVDDEGVINDYVDELEVSGIAGGVVVATGAALVEGYFYENTAQETITIPTPVTDPRIDRIVLRKDPILQTVRITRLAGTENPAPTAPALTQTVGGVFEIPLAQVLITVAGAITVTDERDYPHTPLIPSGVGVSEIETIESDGTLASMDFEDIPQIYTHLRIAGSIRSSVAANIYISLNGDTTDANYWTQSLDTTPAPAVVAAGTNLRGVLNAKIAGMVANEPTGFYLEWMHYRSSFYKQQILVFGSSNASPGNPLLHSGGTLWENTDAIERITLPLSGGVYESGSRATLYGLF